MEDQALYKKHLRDEIRFIETSCRLFDEGDINEAIRIGTAIRVLLHQTQYSIPILAHLDAMSIKLNSVITRNTSDPHLELYEGLLLMTGCGAVPKTSYTREPWPLPVIEWWNQIVSINGRENRLTRQDLVLGAVNKDGGAHSDAKMKSQYKTLSQEGKWNQLLPTEAGTTLKPILVTHLMYLRTIGFEVLTSPELLALA